MGVCVKMDDDLDVSPDGFAGRLDVIGVGRGDGAGAALRRRELRHGVINWSLPQVWAARVRATPSQHKCHGHHAAGCPDVAALARSHPQF